MASCGECVAATEASLLLCRCAVVSPVLLRDVCAACLPTRLAILSMRRLTAERSERENLDRQRARGCV